MAQALPRFCPQCGTPTRANISRCAICGLPVEAMLNPTGNIQSRPGANNEATSLTNIAEPAQIVPTPRKTQQGNQAYSAVENLQATWNASEDFQLPRNAQEGPARTSYAPVPQAGWEWDKNEEHTSSDAEDMPTNPTQSEFPFPPISPTQKPVRNTNDQPPWATQLADAPPPLPPHAQWEATSKTAYNSDAYNPEAQPPWLRQAAESLRPPAQAPWDNANQQARSADAPAARDNQVEFPRPPAQTPWDNANQPVQAPEAQAPWHNQVEFQRPSSQAPWNNSSQSAPDANAQTTWDNANQPAQAPWNNPNNRQTGPGTPPAWSSPVGPIPQTPDSPVKSKRRLGVVLVLLVILVVLGAGGYIAVSALGGHFPGLGNSQAQIKTTNNHSLFNYAGITITLLNVQLAQNFIDDPQSANDGMVRLNLQEENQTSTPINWNYANSAHLLIQGKPALAPTYVQSKGSIAPGAKQTSMIDFTVANGGTLNKMALQLGARGEALMQIPLAGQTDLSQYQPKTTTQKGTTTYFGLNWTLTSAVRSLSLPGQQASSGMEFLTLTLKVDNTLSQLAITGSPFDYLQVKASGKTASLVSTTLPVSFTSGEMGKTGTATFLIAQNSNACTLLLLSQDPGGSGQATIDFQIN